MPLRLRAQGLKLGKNVRFYGMPIVEMAEGSRIQIGNGVVLCSDSRWTALGVNHPVVLRTLRPGARITIGDDCGVSGGVICAAISVDLGRGCLVGANVTIADTDFHPLRPLGRRHNGNWAEIRSKPVQIADNVFVGAGVVILKGVSVGADSVIGASSVVTQNIPAGVIAAGNPARSIRAL